MSDREIISIVEQRLSDPTARGLAAAMTSVIRDGSLPAGTRLPPIRSMARELGLSPTTVSSSWRLLSAAGAVRAQGRRGTVVLSPAESVPSRYREAMNPDLPVHLDLSTGTPDGELLPRLDRVPSPPNFPALGYLTSPVLPELREVVLDDWPLDHSYMTVTDGALDALDLITQTRFHRSDRVAVEHPAFSPVVDMLEAAGAEVVPVGMDEEGLIPDDLTAALREPLAGIVLQPRAQNPTGICMSEERAVELARLLEPHRSLVVEDDSAGMISDRPAISLGRWLPADRVVHIRSFSKSHGPELRLAVVTGPPEVLDHLEARRHLGQGWTSRLLQWLLAWLLQDPQSVATVANARATYARRRRVLAAELARRGLHVPGEDGLCVWVPVASERAAVEGMAAAGIGVAPGSAFLLTPGHPEHVRVTAGLVDESVAADIAGALAEASR